MVLPRFNLGYMTRSTINFIISSQNYRVSRNQALCTLKQFYKQSLRQLRTSLQLRYMKQFNKEELCTRRIEFMVKNSQEVKLKDTMMKNEIRNLYHALSKNNKALSNCRKEIKNVFKKEDIDRLHESWYKEKEYAQKKIIEHFKSKREWIIKKQEEKENNEHPDEIDCIIMKDGTLPAEFKIEPCVYGNIELTDNEKAIIRLPPKFAMFNKVDTLVLRAQFEKAVTNLRWYIHI